MTLPSGADHAQRGPAGTQAGGHPSRPLSAPPSPWSDEAQMWRRVRRALVRARTARRRYAGGTPADTWQEAEAYCAGREADARAMAAKIAAVRNIKRSA